MMTIIPSVPVVLIMTADEISDGVLDNGELGGSNDDNGDKVDVVLVVVDGHSSGRTINVTGPHGTMACSTQNFKLDISTK